LTSRETEREKKERKKERKKEKRRREGRSNFDKSLVSQALCLRDMMAEKKSACH
jgi:hypothetical protein